MEAKRPAPEAAPPRGNTDLGEPGYVLILIDRDVLPVPIGERRVARRALDIAYAPDDDAVGVTLDDLLDLAIERGKRTSEQRHAGHGRHPVAASEAIGPLQSAFAGKALGNVELVGVEDVHAESAVTLDQREG